MSTRATQSARRTEDLIVIPEASPKPRTWPRVLIALAIILAAALGAAGAGLVQQQRLDAARQDASAALAAQRRAEAAALVASEESASAQSRVTSLQQRLERQRRLSGTLRGRRAELQRDRAEAIVLMGRARSALRGALGPRLDAGRHIGYVLAIAPSQSPPRIVVRVGEWFTGQAATDAALQDFAISPGETLSRYLRDDQTQWQILPIAPTAQVRLWRWHGVPGRTTVSPAAFEDIISQPWPANVRVALDPYWIQVGPAGRVLSLTEQPYP
jgi:hypothetical protein